MSEQHDFDKPRNTTGMEFFDVEGYTVATWGPNPDGKPPQNQVHFLLNISNAIRRNIPPLVMRFRSRRAITELVDLLIRYRDEVWNEDGTHTEWSIKGDES